MNDPCIKCGVQNSCGILKEFRHRPVFRVNCPCQTCLVHIKCQEWCEDRKLYSKNTLFACLGEKNDPISEITRNMIEKSKFYEGIK